MRVFQWCRMAGVAAFLVLAAPAMAQNCAGFTDVVDDGVAPGAFCPNVQWVKNRSITLGCTSATLYCPSNNVTRLQMAAFMNRLGTALTPTDLGPVANDSGGTVDLTNAALQIRCAMPADIPAANYPRRVTFNNKVNVYNPTARVDVMAEAVFSTNGGTNWISVPDSKTYQTLNVYSPVSPVQDNVSTYQLGHYDLNVGTTYRFALRVMRNPDTVSPGVGNVSIYCINRVSVVSRNSPTSPFDMGYDPPPVERTGRAVLPPTE